MKKNNEPRVKITNETVKNILVDTCSWTEEADFEVYKYYRSPCKRYVLQESEYSNLADPYTGTGWNLHIDNADMMSLASCDVEYIDQIIALIKIYGEY